VALAADPRLAALLRDISFPAVATAAVGPLFNGTLFFVRIVFTIQSQNNAVIAISDADMATAIGYATQAARPISVYATQYGPNSVVVNTGAIPFAVTLPATTYNDQQLQGWVNFIASNLPSNACVVVLNPPGLVNTFAMTQGFAGYHSMANVPYIWSSVFGQNLTIADQNGAYAQILSHEIAETVVDPRGDSTNPEVCDPCGPNCQIVFLDYFDNAGNYIATSQAFPPGFPYNFFTNGIMTPGTQPCPRPAPASACAYGPLPILIEPSDVSFSPIPVGDVDVRSLTITNIGLGTVTLNFPPSPPLSQATFAWSRSGNVVIVPGEQLRTFVEFSPGALGIFEDVLTITSNAFGSPHNIPLHGRGVPGEPRVPIPAEPS
jgi:hypothetical protein